MNLMNNIRNGEIVMTGTKIFNKANYSIFENAAKTLGINEPELAESIGYCRNAHNHWKRSRYIPKVASIAIEGLLRRNNKNEKGPITLVVKTPRKDLESVKSVLVALGCELTEV